jgi:hypothetical protein
MTIPRIEPESIQTTRASDIGHRAKDYLQEPSTGRVIGTTSRGIFILAPPQRVIFISYETVCGPMTINLAGNLELALAAAINGQEVKLHPDEIALPESNVLILLDRARRWAPSVPPQHVIPLSTIDTSLRQIAKVVIETKRGQGFVPLLPFIFDLTAVPTVPISLQPAIASVLLLKQQLFHQPLNASLPQLKDLMGMGRGLTPSGDDLIAGLLVTLNRLPQRAIYAPELAEFNQLVIEMAFARTTALSANLIDAATAGSADERILNALDGLLTGTKTNAEILTSLEAYGSSSGLDTLAGIALLIQALLKSA